jgi:hypothetical protein
MDISPLTGTRRVVLGFVLVVALAACTGTVASPATSPESSPGTSPATSPDSSPSGSASGSPEGEQAVCDDAEALRTAVDDLRALDVVAVGTDGLNAALEDVRTAGTALRESAGSELAPSVTALETALAGLATTVQQAPQGSIGSGATADAIRGAISDVETAATDLRTQLATTACPS